MNVSFIHHKVAVKPSKIHGFGVFTQEPLCKGETIEICYLLVIDSSETALQDYHFNYQGRSLLALGCGSIYNHADEPNADHAIDIGRRLMYITARRDLKAGEEILIYYAPQWFASRGFQPRSYLDRAGRGSSWIHHPAWVTIGLVGLLVFCYAFFY